MQIQEKFTPDMNSKPKIKCTRFSPDSDNSHSKNTILLGPVVQHREEAGF